MGKTEHEILEMPSSEYEDWIEYHNRIPFSSERLEILVANLIALTANINRNETQAPYTAVDFMPWLSEHQEIGEPTAVETTMQTSQETDRINRAMEMFKSKLEKVQ